MENNKCCAIVLNYNSIDDTKELVFNLQILDNLDEIVIVDNDSPDHSFIKLKEFFRGFTDVYVVKTDKNRGYSYGNNYGAKFILNNFESKYILITNPDVTIPNKNFVKNIVKYLERDPKLAAVTGLMLNYNENLIFSQIAWRIPSFFNYIFMSSDLVRKMYNPIKYKYLDFIGVNEGLSYVECLPGSCFVIRSEILRKVGFFDENLFLYCEEVVLAKKIEQLGLTNGLSFNDFFIHKHFEKRSINDEIKLYLLLSKSRFYYTFNYTKFGKILSPIHLLSILLGMIEKLIILSVKILSQEIVKWLK
ncbi:glycosyltransferase [Methanobacterium spitsbergense]|uniref:Glycosyltransferase family 2 protein n=1 Tax=Methanobacterium spitsbergense TaxID=2874285 RepID=A0A8T5UXW7_9EURY|nr:glycosyltransferase family 2 protein [Methanobacterium spitsbergense]MBZ2167137.1 glycosyltransferase family 2 protein [Methanobacterium spitsbergense]